MKTLLRVIGLAVLALTVTIPVTTLTGCALFGDVAEGSRAEVVRAEQFAKASFALTDQFMEWEFLNRATLGDDVKEFAKRLEKDFPPKYAALRATTKAYKSFPSTENLDALQKSKMVLELVYNQLILLAPAEVEAKAEKKAATLTLE